MDLSLAGVLQDFEEVRCCKLAGGLKALDRVVFSAGIAQAQFLDVGTDLLGVTVTLDQGFLILVFNRLPGVFKRVGDADAADFFYRVKAIGFNRCEEGSILEFEKLLSEGLGLVRSSHVHEVREHLPVFGVHVVLSEDGRASEAKRKGQRRGQQGTQRQSHRGNSSGGGWGV